MSGSISATMAPRSSSIWRSWMVFFARNSAMTLRSSLTRDAPLSTKDPSPYGLDGRKKPSKAEPVNDFGNSWTRRRDPLGRFPARRHRGRHGGPVMGGATDQFELDGFLGPPLPVQRDDVLAIVRTDTSLSKTLCRSTAFEGEGLIPGFWKGLIWTWTR